MLTPDQKQKKVDVAQVKVDALKERTNAAAATLERLKTELGHALHELEYRKQAPVREIEKPAAPVFEIPGLGKRA